MGLGNAAVGSDASARKPDPVREAHPLAQEGAGMASREFNNQLQKATASANDSPIAKLGFPEVGLTGAHSATPGGPSGEVHNPAADSAGQSGENIKPTSRLGQGAAGEEAPKPSTITTLVSPSDGSTALSLNLSLGDLANLTKPPPSGPEGGWFVGKEMPHDVS